MRLEGYDYGLGGMYFLTICVREKQCLLWDGMKALSDIGKIADNAIRKIETVYNNAIIDKYVVMPNHIHILLLLTENETTPDGCKVRVPTTISGIIHQMKRRVTLQVGFSIWQKSFYDRIVRNEREYSKIWEYIETNPDRWSDDQYFPAS